MNISDLISGQFLSWTAFQALRPKISALLILWSGDGQAGEVKAARALLERLLDVKNESEWVQLVDFGMTRLVNEVIKPMTEWKKP